MPNWSPSASMESETRGSRAMFASFRSCASLPMTMSSSSMPTHTIVTCGLPCRSAGAPSRWRVECQLPRGQVLVPRLGTEVAAYQLHRPHRPRRATVAGQDGAIGVHVRPLQAVAGAGDRHVWLERPVVVRQSIPLEFPAYGPGQSAQRLPFAVHTHPQEG